MNMFRTMSCAMVVAAVVFVGNASAMDLGKVPSNITAVLGGHVPVGMAVHVGGSILKEDFDKGEPYADVVVKSMATGGLVYLLSGNQDAAVKAGLASAVVLGGSHVAPEFAAARVRNTVSGVVDPNKAKMGVAVVAAGLVGLYVAGQSKTSKS